MNRDNRYIDVVRTSEETPRIIKTRKAGELIDGDVLIVDSESASGTRQERVFVLFKEIKYGLLSVVYEGSRRDSLMVQTYSRKSINVNNLDFIGTFLHEELFSGDRGYDEARVDFDRAKEIARRVLGR